ncbi:MAG: hypothetical protein NE327_05350 [Lentisphaeraceae bacterium]|nr:hypothetical protein [Lentisphaeraceae bacterium]
MNKNYLAIVAAAAVLVAYLTFTSTTNSIDDLDDFSSENTAAANSSPEKTVGKTDSRRSSAEYQEDEKNQRRINVHRTAESRGLTLIEIEELGEQFKNEKDSILRKELLDKLIAGMTAENALDIRKYVEHMSDRSDEWKAFHKAYGAVAGQVAVLHGENTKGRDVELSLVGWVTADPDAAMEWYRALDEKSKKSMFSQERLSLAVLEGLAENDPQVATDFMVSLNTKGGNSWRASRIVGDKIWKEAVASGNVEEAIKWTENLPSEELKNSSQALMARNYAKLNPLEAASWVEALNADGQSNKYAVGMVVDSWRKTDPAAAVSWLSSFENDKNRLNGTYYQAFSSWADQDPGAATQYLESMNNSRSKDYAIYGLTRTLSSKEPQQAMELANSIEDSGIRLRSIINNSRTAFKDDPEGLQSWLATSNLSSKDRQKVLSSYNKKRRR